MRCLLCPSTIAALKDWFTPVHGYGAADIKEAGETIELLEIFQRFVDVQSVCSTLEGKLSLNPFRAPLYSENFEDCIPFEFLKKFLVWMEEIKRRNIRKESCFTEKTRDAAILSTRSTISLVRWAFNNINDLKYILLGKMTQDAEEQFFGKLRHASTRNFHSSPLQFKQSLKKLNDRRLLGWMFKNDGGFLLKEDLPTFDNAPTLDAVETLLPVLDTNYFDEEIEVRNQASVHVAGYAAANLVKKMKRESGPEYCKQCASFFVLKKGGDIIDNDYHAYLQRGGLTVATENANLMAFHVEVSEIIDKCLQRFLPYFYFFRHLQTSSSIPSSTPSTSLAPTFISETSSTVSSIGY